MTEEEKLALIPVDRPLYTIEEQTRDLPVEDFLAMALHPLLDLFFGCRQCSRFLGGVHHPAVCQHHFQR